MKKVASARKRVASPKSISTRVKQRAGAHASMNSHHGPITLAKGGLEAPATTTKVKGSQPSAQRPRPEGRNVKTPGNRAAQGPKITAFQLKVADQTQKENLTKPKSNKVTES